MSAESSGDPARTLLLAGFTAVSSDSRTSDGSGAVALLLAGMSSLAVIFTVRVRAVIKVSSYVSVALWHPLDMTL